MQYIDIYSEIDRAVESKSDIIFLTYSMLDDTDDKIRYTLQRIFKEYEKEEWITPIFSAISACDHFLSLRSFFILSPNLIDENSYITFQ